MLLMLGSLATIAVTLLASAVAAIAQYILKKYIRTFEFNTKEVIAIMTRDRTLLGIGLYGVSLVLYLYALRSTPVISLIYPIFSSSFIFIFLISRHVLKESFSSNRVLGIILIVIGIFLISLTFPA